MTLLLILSCLGRNYNALMASMSKTHGEEARLMFNSKHNETSSSEAQWSMHRQTASEQNSVKFSVEKKKSIKSVSLNLSSCLGNNHM